jgi:hypothetical protein
MVIVPLGHDKVLNVDGGQNIQQYRLGVKHR